MSIPYLAAHLRGCCLGQACLRLVLLVFRQRNSILNKDKFMNHAFCGLGRRKFLRLLANTCSSSAIETDLVVNSTQCATAYQDHAQVVQMIRCGYEPEDRWFAHICAISSFALLLHINSGIFGVRAAAMKYLAEYLDSTSLLRAETSRLLLGPVESEVA